MSFERDLAESGFAVMDERIEGELLDRLVLETRAQLAPSPRDIYHVDGAPIYGERIRRTFDLVGKSPALLELLDNDLVHRVCTLFGPSGEHALLSSATALEVSNQGLALAQPLHRDEDVYLNAYPRLPGYPECLLNLMIAGTDFTADNGATLLVPGSNHWEADRVVRPDDPVVSLKMPKGGCAVWLGSTLHGAGVNVTSTSRLGITLAFNLPWLRTIENQYLLLDRAAVARLPQRVQRLLGYDSYGSLGLHGWLSPQETWLPAAR